MDRIELTRCVPRVNPTLGVASLTFSRSLAEVQADHVTLPPPHYLPPSRPIYSHRKVLLPLGVVVPPLVP